MTTDPFSDLYGSTFECDCGRTHSVQPARILYRIGASAGVPELARRAAPGRRVAVLADARTYDAAGRDVCAVFESDGRRPDLHILADPPGGGRPVCDHKTLQYLQETVPAVDVVCPVGSGVVSDLGKWLAFRRGVPLVTFATALSMNGYASANVAPTVDGVKTLVRARPPSAVAGDPAVFASAPYEMTAAGLGDLVAKSTSSVDWRLNHHLFGDYYCERSVGLIAEIEPLYLDGPDRVAALEPYALEAMFHALLLTGVAMTLAETSAPASGGEHLVSHTLDMMSALDGVPHDLHGRQVGVGTLVACELYERVLALESPNLVEPETEIDRAFWGQLAGEVKRHYARKIPRLRAARESLSRPGAWDALRGALGPMLRPAGRVRACLSGAGAACRAGQIGCEPERLLAALRHAHEIRDRFTILDLARLAGVLPDAAPELVALVS